MEENLEKLIKQDILEKKKIAIGVKHRASRTGKIGKWMTPSNLMTKEQKKEYLKSGELVVYNMYDEIMDYNEFEKLTDEAKRTALMRWREKYSTQAIINKWGISRVKLYNLIHKLDIPTDAKKGRKTDIEQKQPPHFNPYLHTNLSIVLEGYYKGRDIREKLEKLLNFFNDDETYQIQIRIIEITQD